MNDRTATGSKTKYSAELIEETKKLWSSESGEPISDEDAIEMIDNVTGFFDYLHSLDQKYNGNRRKDENLDTLLDVK